MNGRKRKENEPRIIETKVILVEGVDDKKILKELLKVLEVTGIQLYTLCGDRKRITKVIKAFKVRGYLDDLEILGVVVDANSNKETRIESLKNIFRNLNLPCPNSVNTLSNEGNPHTGFIVIPPNEDRGKMEDLCLKSVENDNVMSCIENLFSCFEDENIISAEDYPKDVSKAKAQVFMASRRKTCTSIGVASEKKYWNFDHSCFIEVKDFLRLFNN